jgi:hypothetical protein
MYDRISTAPYKAKKQRPKRTMFDSVESCCEDYDVSREGGATCGSEERRHPMFVDGRGLSLAHNRTFLYASSQGLSLACNRTFLYASSQLC